MKKYVRTFISVLFVTILITACGTNNNPSSGVNQSPGVSVHMGQPSQEPPVQPIVFDSLASAVEFVKNPNFSEYYEKWQYSYQSMVDKLSVDGQLLIATHMTADRRDDFVVLYPEVEYEDVGMAFWFKSEDISYQVLIYSIKNGEEYTFDPETESILDYLEKRLGVPQKYDYEYVDTNNLQMPQMVIHKIDLDKGRNAAKCMIDDTHYIVIKTEADKTALLSFVDGLQIDSLSLD